MSREDYVVLGMVSCTPTSSLPFLLLCTFRPSLNIYQLRDELSATHKQDRSDIEGHQPILTPPVTESGIRGPPYQSQQHIEVVGCLERVPIRPMNTHTTKKCGVYGDFSYSAHIMVCFGAPFCGTRHSIGSTSPHSTSVYLFWGETSLCESGQACGWKNTCCVMYLRGLIGSYI